ncbi:Ureidoglycolate lyase [Cedecea neteri]|uniref:Ureidoglycolate lyase n=1 Tax=Cedecea neteri TaxID=158822 RepID=A0A2X3JCY8_9ENTR|nr:Ureidoglycolate lyase [Cedecea neteri]
MKICRYGEAGQEKPGVFDNHFRLRDLSSLVADITPETLPVVLLALQNEDDIIRFPLVDGEPRLGGATRQHLEVCGYRPELSRSRKGG